MNILILSWRGPGHPNAGGAEQTTFEHAKGWVKAGHSVTLFTSYYIGAKREEDLNGVIIIRRGAQFLGVQIKAFVWYLFESHKKFDIIVDEFHGIPFFTAIYMREKKLAFIHEVTKEIWWLNPWLKPFNLIPAMLGIFIEPFIFKLIYRKIPFMTVSESTKKDLCEWGVPSKNITVVLNGLSVSHLQKIPPKEKKKTVIFLGALSNDKGIENAIKTFSILNQKEDLQFWIVGKGQSQYVKNLVKLCLDLKIDKKVKFWGYVSGELKFKLLSSSHILINPSIREGWGLVVIEAASVGTPSVGYNVPGLRDSIVNGKTGILCDPNPNSGAEAILSLLKNDEKYETMRKNCFKWAKQFKWNKSVEKSLRLIENISEA